jgi:hypothetical protein
MGCGRSMPFLDWHTMNAEWNDTVPGFVHMQPHGIIPEIFRALDAFMIAVSDSRGQPHSATLFFSSYLTECASSGLRVNRRGPD